MCCMLRSVIQWLVDCSLSEPCATSVVCGAICLPVRAMRPLSIHSTMVTTQRTSHVCTSPATLTMTSSHSILHELPLLVIQRAGGACAQPSGDAVEVVGVRAGAPCYTALLGLGWLGLTCDARHHQLVVTTESGTTGTDETDGRRQKGGIGNKRGRTTEAPRAVLWCGLRCLTWRTYRSRYLRTFYRRTTYNRRVGEGPTQLPAIVRCWDGECLLLDVCGGCCLTIRPECDCLPANRYRQREAQNKRLSSSNGVGSGRSDVLCSVSCLSTISSRELSFPLLRRPLCRRSLGRLLCVRCPASQQPSSHPPRHRDQPSRCEPSERYVQVRENSCRIHCRWNGRVKMLMRRIAVRASKALRAAFAEMRTAEASLIDTTRTEAS